jgi:hypothetical protein
MKITIEIGGKDYTFEMNRYAYKRLLADKEYAEMQNEISKRVKAKSGKGKSVKAVTEEVGEEMVDGDISAVLLSNMVMEEQIFYYSLLPNQPDMTSKEASALLDTAYAEYGSEEVSKLVSTLMENFTQRGEEPKKKMVMRMS